MYLFLIFTFIYFENAVMSSSISSPCKVSDFNCLKKNIRTVLPQIIGGIPEFGVESSDPQFMEIIEGNLPNLNYTLYNSSLVGYKNCAISDLELNEDISNIHFEMNCPDLMLSGQYEINGLLLTLPIEGNGSFIFDKAHFILTFDIKMETRKGENGKSHFYINSYKMKSKPLGVRIDFKNLFNGHKELADAAKEFAKENWLQITGPFQYPIWNVSIQKLARNINKYLENVPIEDILLN